MMDIKSLASSYTFYILKDTYRNWCKFSCLKAMKDKKNTVPLRECYSRLDSMFDREIISLSIDRNFKPSNFERTPLLKLSKSIYYHMNYFRKKA